MEVKSRGLRPKRWSADGRTDGIRCRCAGTCPSARGARARPTSSHTTLSDSAAPVTIVTTDTHTHANTQWRTHHTHPYTYTRTYPYTHKHTNTQLTWHKRKRAQRNARSPTTVISYSKAFASRDGHLLFSDHSPVRLVRSSR